MFETDNDYTRKMTDNLQGSKVQQNPAKESKGQAET